MRKIVVAEFVSLDGVMEAPDQWQLKNDLFSEDMGKEMQDGLFASDGLLLGRVTWQAFAGAWPSMTDETGFADRMNSMPKFVVSKTLDDAGEWNNSTLIKGDVVAEISKLNQQPGQDIYQPVGKEGKG